MAIRRVPGHDSLEYLLICHDAEGRELREGSGKEADLLSQRAIDTVDGGHATDVFVISHGWKGDVPAAIDQYDRWIGAMASCEADRALIRKRLPTFRPLLVGLHWPSLPWGDEELTGPAVSFDSATAVGKLVDDYAERIANTAAAREALATIFEAALDDMAPSTLPEQARDAYRVLDREANLAEAREGAAPGADREPFDPERAYQNEREEISFGAASEGILSVLRQLSFWKMKDRARRFGETGAHALLRSMQDAAARKGPSTRFHLMGHSFGCIVMSGMLHGPDGKGMLLKPVDSLFLVQGALSLWSFCSSIPSVPHRPGYFRNVIADQAVAGPIVVTMSEHDTAVRKYYPLGAGIRRQVEYTPGELPKYGGIGVFGARGPGIDTHDVDMGDCDHEYRFMPCVVYNLDAAAYISKMEGASGAHNDIAHPEVAHAFWQAVTPSEATGSEKGVRDVSEDSVVPLDGALYFNGIDASTGAYVTLPMTPRQVAKLAANERLDADDLEELRRKWQRKVESHFAPIAGVDPQDLSQAGWGVVFAPDVGDDVKEAMQPLLALRKDQAKERYHDFPGDRAFRANDSKNTFLGRSRAAPGPSNPKKVPYYLLLVGSPETIPFKVQYQLDVQYAVGRVHFDTPDEYANYANTVVAAETGQLRRPKTVSLFGVRNRGDVATQLSADHLIGPLAETLRKNETNWDTQRFLGPECTRAALVDLLRAEKAPALLISASHGIGLPNGDSRQFRHQGAILCQDWPGPLRHRGPIPEEFYVSADHVPSGTRVDGLVAFFFACYGGGTPTMDDFAHLTQGAHAQIAPRPFVAALPKTLLGRSNGALAVIGHVERAWTYSFLWGQSGRQLDVFESAISSLLAGGRIGAAMEWFNTRYAELSSDLTVAIGDRRAERARPETETQSDDLELAGMWTANNDARSYVVLGDPAVRLAVSR